MALPLAVYLMLAVTSSRIKVTSSEGEKIPLTLAGFASIHIEEGGWSSAGCIPAIELALEDVNAREDILPGYHLNWTYQDTKCMAGNAINILFKHLQSPPTKIMVLGGGCSVATAPVARTTPYFNLVQMSYSTGSGELSDRSVFPTFFRTSASDVDLNEPHIYVMRQYNWTRVSTLHQNDPLFSVTIDDLQRRLAAENITQVLPEIFNKNPRQQLINIKAQDARIIVLNAYEKQSRLAFCEIYKLGMYGQDYQWLIPGWYNRNWYDINDTECTPAQLRAALQFAFSFSDLKVDESGQIGISNQTYLEYSARYLASPLLPKYGYNDYHTVAYDAVWAVALALDKAVKILENEASLINVTEAGSSQPLTVVKNLEHFTYEDEHIKTLLFDLLSRTDFLGVSGSVSFQATGDREAITQIRQIQDGVEVPVAVYFEATKSVTYYSNSEIQWPNGISPPLDGVRVRRETTYIDMYVYGGMGGLALLGIMLGTSFLSYNLANMDCKYIKMSSPRLNNLIVVGGLLCYFSVLVFGLDGKFIPSGWIPVSCTVQTWVLTVGFSLAFGAMFAKTWRVHVIFTQKGLSQPKPLQDQHLYMFVAALVVVDVAILACWMVLDPIHVEMADLYTEKVNSTHETLHQIEMCQSDHKLYWLCGLYAKNGLLLIFGVFLAYETKQVHVPAMNDSKYIGMCVYNVVVMSLMGVTVTLVLQTQLTIAYVFAAMSIIFCDTGALCLLFLPKIAHLRKHPEEKDPKAQQSASSTFQYTMNKMKKKNLGSMDSGLDQTSVSEVEASQVEVKIKAESGGHI